MPHRLLIENCLLSSRVKQWEEATAPPPTCADVDGEARQAAAIGHVQREELVLLRRAAVVAGLGTEHQRAGCGVDNWRGGDADERADVAARQRLRGHRVRQFDLPHHLRMQEADGVLSIKPSLAAQSVCMLVGASGFRV